uniref:Ig-like domain-containing protein n=1 Tax=Myripristis murdjan TaxID=586833 RepID=A0A667YT16_9TELE
KMIDQVDQNPTDMYKKPGETAQLNCSHNIQDYYIILWYRQSENQQMQLLGYIYYGKANLEPGVTVQMGGGANQGETSTLTTDELSLNSSAVYFCAASYHSAANPAYFGQGTKLTVLEYNVTAPTVKILPPSSKECKNKKKTLVCVASGFYPDHVSVFWQIDEVTETNGVATDNNAVRKNESYSITSRLRVSAKDWRSRTFTCTVTFFNGTDYKQYSDSLKGAAGKSI